LIKVDLNLPAWEIPSRSQAMQQILAEGSIEELKSSLSGNKDAPAE
jgi:hypothetical protein